MSLDHGGCSAGDILFDDDHTGTSYVEIRDASTGNIKTLTTGYTCATSRDGSKIAFVTKADDGSGSSTLHIMNSDGSAITQLVPRDMNSHDNGTDSTTDQDPRRSPDGQWIAFDRTVNRGTYGNYYQIDKVRADGTGLNTVVSTVQTSSSLSIDQFPTWSPTKDATGNYRIAFSNFTPATGYQIYIVNANGTNLHLVSTIHAFGGTAVSANVPNWSPDGSRIYFLQATGTEPIDYYSSSDGFTSSDATISQLQADTNALSLQLSADGNTLIFRIFSCMGCTVGVETLSTDGTGSPVPQANSLNEDDPSLVPATWPNANTKTIVGLGDSVAAGEGINYRFIWTGSKWKRTGPSNPAWMDTTPALGANYQQCHQSGLGYPNLIGLNGGNYQVYNMACTGASARQNNTSDLPEDGGVLDAERFDTNSQPYPQSGYTEIGGDTQDPSKTVPAQLGGTCTGCDPPNSIFNAHNPDVVLLTLGADDINFAYWVSKCYALGPSCDTPTNTATLHSQLRLERIDLTTVFGQLNQWAAGKHKVLRVLVTNYYNPIDPSNTGCRDYSGPAGLGIVSGERTWIEKGLAALNSNIAADVTTAQSKDLHLSVSLVDLSSLFQNGTPANPGSHAWCTQTRGRTAPRSTTQSKAYSWASIQHHSTQRPKARTPYTKPWMQRSTRLRKR